jgi:hypothetical protein
MAAVVQQNHIASANLLADFFFYVFRRLSLPVPASHIPHHRLQTKRSHDFQSTRPASSKGRPKKSRMRSRRIRQDLLTILQLRLRLARRRKDQIRMAESMIANNVSCPHQLEGDIRPLLDIAPDQKKCCLHVVSSQNLQQTQGVWVVRTIVESQRQLPGSPLQPGKSPTIPLPGRSHGLVASRDSRGRSETCADDQATHNVAIVNCFSASVTLGCTGVTLPSIALEALSGYPAIRSPSPWPTFSNCPATLL